MKKAPSVKEGKDGANEKIITFNLPQETRKEKQKMKTAQIILKGLGKMFEALANGLAFIGCGLQDASEDLPSMAYKAQMALTRSRRACKRTLCKARMIARVAWSGACMGLLWGLTALANIGVALWMVGKVAWGFLGVSSRLAWHFLTAMGTWAGAIAANVGTWARGTATSAWTKARDTALTVGTWGKDAWAFRQELTREWA